MTTRRIRRRERECKSKGERGRERVRKIQSLMIPHGKCASRNKSLGPMRCNYDRARMRRQEYQSIRAVTCTYKHIQDISLQIRDISLSTDLAEHETRFSNVGISMRLRPVYSPAFVGSVIVPALGPYRHSKEGPHALNECILRASLFSSFFSLRFSLPFFVPSVRVCVCVYVCAEQDTLSPFGRAVPSVPFERRVVREESRMSR